MQRSSSLTPTASPKERGVRSSESFFLGKEWNAAFFGIGILFFFLFQSCNQIQKTSKQSSESGDTIQSQSKNQAIESADKNDNQKSFPEEYAELNDSVMTRGNYVVFFMRNGEWANEIGAEEVANDFSYNATEAMDSLNGKGFKASFLIGDKIKIGLENGSAFKISQADCVMGVVLIASGKTPRLECGVKSAENFWSYYKEYFNSIN